MLYVKNNVYKDSDSIKEVIWYAKKNHLDVGTLMNKS